MIRFGGHQVQISITPGEALLATGLTILALTFALKLLPDNFSWFNAPWLLHPFEQEHLTISRNLALGGGLTIEGADFTSEFGSEDKGFVDGRFVPRGVHLISFTPSRFSSRTRPGSTSLLSLAC